MSTNKKSTQFTVFVRFSPPLAGLRRHHAEQWFAGVGPIRKCSLIHQDEKVYGFVKYTCQEDAENAVREYDRKAFNLDGDMVQVQMVLADRTTASGNQSTPTALPEATATPAPEASLATRRDTHEVYRKKACRLILRNLAFAATEKDVRRALAAFGPLVEVHIPTVAGAPTHRGFAFVTFESAKDANECLRAADTLLIKKRSVQVAHALNKAEYDQQKQKSDEVGSRKRARNEKQQQDKKDSSIEKHDTDTSDSSQSSQGVSEDSSDDSSSSGEGGLDEEGDDEGADDEGEDEHGDEKRGDSKTNAKDEKSHNLALQEKRALFVRNLPFDASRHDLFELFRKYGRIESIYLCKGPNGLAKGTAFVNFANPPAAQRALQAAGTGEKTEASHLESGILLNGRRLLLDLAIDKETASTLTLDKKQSGGKDRRNIYLRTEGRVDDPTEWESLPESDKEKRQHAWADKNTKLKSPIFFINPTRLSFRNLAKHVDETALKKLLVKATSKGLDKKLVTAQDQIAAWKAKGEMTTREILARIQEIDVNEDPDKSILPAFDPTNVKKYIPSVFIDRDFGKGNNKDAPSRGFGFAQFEHHIHALACLRELNNNTEYTEEYVAGGSRALQAKRKLKRNKAKPIQDAETSSFVGADGKVKLPRLIVEFAVENKVKAKQQMEHKVQQEVNAQTQKMNSKAERKKEKKSKRGARQRENRRKAREAGSTSGASISDKTERIDGISGADEEPPQAREKPQGVMPPKKKAKIDPSDKKFNDLVETYKRSFRTAEKMEEASTSQRKSGKRWFD